MRSLVLKSERDLHQLHDTSSYPFAYRRFIIRFRATTYGYSIRVHRSRESAASKSTASAYNIHALPCVSRIIRQNAALITTFAGSHGYIIYAWTTVWETVAFPVPQQETHRCSPDKHENAACVVWKMYTRVHVDLSDCMAPLAFTFCFRPRVCGSVLDLLVKRRIKLLNQ